MTGQIERLAREHGEVTRRYFLQLGAAGVTALRVSRLWAQDGEADSLLTEAISRLEYLTREENFINSHMKTCARFVHTRKKMKAGQPAPVTGVAQVGMSGVSRVQYWLCPHDAPLPKDDPYFTKAEWKDADVLPPPDPWGGGCRTAGCRQCHARLTLPPVNRTAGQFATRSLIGRHCFQPYVPANTTFAAVQSMPTALPSQCHVRSPNQAITLFSVCRSSSRHKSSTHGAANLILGQDPGLPERATDIQWSTMAGDSRRRRWW